MNIVDSYLQPSDLVDFGGFTEASFVNSVSQPARELIISASNDQHGLRAEEFINSVYQLTLSYPYRYASANLSASDVILRQRGMCTNKAIAAVALLRFAGIPAGFLVLKYRNSAHQQKLHNPALSSKIKSITMHIAPVVWFHGRWVPIDASDDPETARLVHHYEPPQKWLGQDVLCIDVDEIESSLGVWPCIEAITGRQKWSDAEFVDLNNALEDRMNAARL
jgi:transglutaminase-like putative cysteine protease